jgi:hypothetical protein
MDPNLPPWVTSDAESIAREAAPYRAMSPEERGALMAAACRAGIRLLRSRDDRDRVLAHRDPLPESSVRALERLQKEAARSRREGGSEPGPAEPEPHG